MSCQASLRIAGKAKYKRMIELGNTMLFVYANPEPMLSMIVLKTVERQCAEALQREPKLRFKIMLI